MNKKSWCLLGIMMLTLLILMLSLRIGSVAIPLAALYDWQEHATLYFLFWQVRFPRTMAAFLIGGSLAISGATLQALFRNPLVEPGIIGVSSGAALLAALAIVCGHYLPWEWLSHDSILFYLLSTFLIPLSASVGGLTITLLLYYFARRQHYINVSSMLLLGIAVNAFVGALIGILTYLADDSQLRAMTFWSLGSVADISMGQLLVLISMQIIILPCMLYQSYKMNLMVLGEVEAKHLGVNVENLKKIQIWCVAFLVGTAVALSGGIGFIGLVIPHLVRISVGIDHRMLLPLAYILGGSLLVLADICSRMLAAPAEIPIGIFTALMGAPFLTYLILRTGKHS